MNPFRRNKNKIDSKIPSDDINSKEPTDGFISSKVPPKESVSPPKVKIEKIEVGVDDFNPPPKKDKSKQESIEKKKPSDYGTTDESFTKSKVHGLPKELLEKKEYQDKIPTNAGKRANEDNIKENKSLPKAVLEQKNHKEEFKPSNLGTRDSKIIKQESKSLPKEIFDKKKKEQEKPVSHGFSNRQSKESGKNNPLPKHHIKEKELKNIKTPSTMGGFKEKENRVNNRKIPKNEFSQNQPKDKKPPATINIQTKIPKDKKPKDEIPKEKINTKNPK